jgi:plasmid stability protein
MTITVKLPDALEQSLRFRCAQEGRSLSEVMRDALAAYLAQPGQMQSAWDLGQEVFGQYGGVADLAENRKAQALAAWAEKWTERGHDVWPGPGHTDVPTVSTPAGPGASAASQ